MVEPQSILSIILTPLAAILVISLEFLLYSLAGPLPSALIFLFTQLYVISGTLFIGTLNVSALLQVSFITNQGWVQSISYNHFIKIVQQMDL